MSDPILADAVALGVLEGVTEFIPVSSTGHLVLLGNVLNYVGDKAAAFSIFIQLGAILSVVVLYFDYFWGLLKCSEAADDPRTGFCGGAGILKLFLTSLPALIAGALLHDFIKDRLFQPLPIAAALLAGGIVMIWIENREKRIISVQRIGEASYTQCLGVGLFQCLALWPGMSRSGSTIIGAMLLGFERKAAAEFSFIIAVPIMAAAVGYDMLKSYSSLESGDVLFFTVGFVVSFITAAAAIKFFIGILRRYTLRAFGIYRIVLGLLVLAVALAKGA